MLPLNSRTVSVPVRADYITGLMNAEYVRQTRPITPGAEVLTPGQPESRNRTERLRFRKTLANERCAITAGAANISTRLRQYRDRAQWLDLAGLHAELEHHQFGACFLQPGG